MKYRLLTLLCFVICPVFVMADSEPRKIAVLIGIDDYEKMRPLRYARKDIEALRDQLYRIGFKKENVFCLTCGGKSKDRPTKERIETTIHHAIELADRGDIVFLALTGHGIESAEGQARFCSVDADAQDLLKTTVPISDVFDALGRCKATFKLMTVDACREDPFRGRGALGARTFETLDNPPKGCVLLQSCAKGELSLEDDELKHGIFTYYLIQGLAGKAADKEGKVTLFGLASYVGEQTRRKAYQLETVMQRPYLRGEVTDFVLNGFVVDPIETLPPYPKGTGPKPSKSLSEALLENDLEELRRHISQGTSLDAADENDVVPMGKVQSEEALVMLLRAGANNNILNEKNQEGQSALYSFIWNNKPRLELINELLLLVDVDIDQKTTDGFPLIAAAIYHGDWRVFQLFLKRGADFVATMPLGNNATYLHLAAANGKEKVIDFLIENGCDMNALNDTNQSPLLFAAWHGNDVAFHHLLKKGAKLDVHFQDDLNGTLLHSAVGGGNLRVVKTLVGAGADVNAKSKISGDTPLDTYSNKDVEEFLRSKGGKKASELKK